MGLVQTRKTCA